MSRSAITAALLLAALPAQGAAPAAAPAEATVSLEGRVVDLRGEPVPAAKVWVVTWREPDVALARGMCDGDGFFRIGRVPKQDLLQVRATATGKDVASVGVQVGTPLKLRLHEAATVRGVLRDAKGAPVAGAIVRAADNARGLDSADAFATTGEDGAFRLTDVPLAPMRIAAVVPGEGLYAADVGVAGDTDVTLQREPGKTTSLTIVVVDLPADAVARTGVSLWPNGAYSRLPPPWHRPQLLADGTCRLRDLPDTDYELQPTASGLAFEPAKQRVKAGAGPHEVRFVARPVGSEAQQCAARLCDAAGKPIEAVKLSLRAANSSQRTEATSDAEGKLRFASHLGSGAQAVIESLDDRWVLDQEKDGNARFDRHSFSQHACTVDPRTTLELRAVAACSAVGRVLLPDGRPAAFVRVSLESDHPGSMPHWQSFASATTDRSGVFQFRRVHALDEAVRILVESDEGAAAGEPFRLQRAGDQAKVPDLKLAPPARIEGIVVDAQQRPAPGVRVWLRDWEFARNSQKSGSVVEVLTDRQGRYRFAAVPPGGAWLQLLVGIDERASMQRAVEPFEVEPGKTYTHDLQVPAK